MKDIRILCSKLYKSTAFRLILLSFVVYNANLRSITSFDTNPTRYLPISLIKNFSLDLDEFTFLHRYPDWWIEKYHEEEKSSFETRVPTYLQFARGHYMSIYPIMPAILSVPVYVIPVVLGLTNGPVSVLSYNQTEIVGTMLSKISSSAAVAISVGIIYLTLLRLTSRKNALWLSLIYAFATSSWSISSQGLWQSAMSQPTLALAFYYLIKAKESERNVIYASIPLALSVASRPPNIIFALILLIYVIHKHSPQLKYFVIFPLIIGSLLLLYNSYYFGNPIGGYKNKVNKWDPNITDSEKITFEDSSIEKETSEEGPAETFDDTFATLRVFHSMKPVRLLGLLFSPSRGLLVYSPFLIFSFLAIGVAVYSREQILMVYISIATLLSLLLFSSWPGGWFGAFNYGYRLLVDLIPGLILLITLVFGWILSNKILKFLFITMVSFSVFIQIIGTFFYPCEWFNTPVPATKNQQRFWDWKDPEFLRCLKTGPVEPEGLSLMKKYIKKH